MTTTVGFDILISKLQMLSQYPINMSKNNYQQASPQTQEEALKIAKSIQRPAQTKEQTKLITLGIQQGIDLYKRQQKEKARELNKQRKKLAKQKETEIGQSNSDESEIIIYQHHWLPWTLLTATWLGIGIYAATGYFH
jgi:hypothetical protein